MGETERIAKEGVRILIAEDSATQAEQLRYLLEQQGFCPLVAADGLRALEIARNRKPALVIADILMPAMDGYELCRQIKADTTLREIPVILLTSLSDANDVLEALKCGANNFLTKPYDSSHLLSRIQYSLTNRELLKSNRMQMGLEITLGGARHHITAERQQIFDFLLATYESYSRKNDELNGTAEKLRQLNDRLEEMVAERTDALMEEIEERKQTARTLRETRDYLDNLFNYANAPIIVWDPAARITRFNRAFERMTGYAGDEVIGRDIRMLFPEASRNETLGTIKRTLGGESMETVEIPILRKDGAVRVALWNSATLYGADGTTVVATIAQGQDITERKEAEEALRASEEQLRQSQKIEAVGRLAGGVAHDFNNLLTAITGYSEMLLAEMPEGDPLREDVEEIQKAAERAAALTRQLLAFSRRQILQPQVLDLNIVVAGMDKMLRRIIGEDIDFETCPGESLWNVRVDPGQIEQVIVNLAVNSRDAMPQGGKVTIETANVALDDEYTYGHRSVAPGPYVMLAVSDTGHGMDEETRSRIFEPFFTTKGNSEGTGLGLSTVYGIVKQSGGHVWVYSEPGQGTTMKVYFPRVMDAAVAQETRIPVKTVGGSETVLVVEDDSPIRKLVREILERNGYEVLAACDGEDAIRVCGAHEGTIHLLLTDVVMPRMSGAELSRRLSELGREMKTLFMSGYTDNAIVHHGVLDPGKPLLQKPFTPTALLRKVREVLEEIRP
jgi:PAS domain S-box-containing protein